MANEKINQRALTSALKKIAAEAYTIDNEGTPISRSEALARLMWNKALGWTEIVRDANGTAQEIKHPPEAWAMQYVYERYEGKTAPAILDREVGITAADKVRELAKSRMNQRAMAIAGPPKFTNG